MNKISKKIVALVTMAAFVLTLVPAAAFAATEPTLSTVQTVDKNVSAEVGEKVAISYDLRDVNDAASAASGTVFFWAEDASGNVTRLVNFYKTEAGETFNAQKTNDTINYGASLWLDQEGFTAIQNGDIYVSFTQAGTYTIKAGVYYGDASLDSSAVNVSMDDIIPFANVDNYKTIQVSQQDLGAVDKVEINDTVATNGKANGADVYANNVDTKTLKVEAFVGNAVAKNEPFTVTTSSSNLTVTPKDMNGNAFGDEPVVTDKNGAFQVDYSASKAGTYKIYLEAEDGYKVTVTVKATDNNTAYPATIETTVNNAQILNVNDMPKVSFDENLADAVQFVIKDQNGDVLTGEDAIATDSKEPAANYNDNAQYVKVVAKPDKFKGSASDFKLAWNEDADAYTIYHNAAATNKLVAGEYTIRVALYTTGDYADATFTVDQFGKIAGIKVKFANADNNSKIEDLNEVALNSDSTTTVNGTVVFVDKNGIEQPATATDYSIGANGTAVEKLEKKSGNKFTLTLKKADEDLLGTKVNVIAIDSNNGYSTTGTLTIVDANKTDAYTVAFDSENGEVGKNNTVNLSIVDEDGNVAKEIDGTVTAYVADKSVEDANVDVTVSDSELTDGKNAKITVYSDKETKADIVVAVVTEDGIIYANTLSYTFGAADINADKIVAMTIGSTDMIVNNEIVNGDAAPYVADGRTMVPIRALTETFGAKVDYDNDAKTVTIVDGDTTVVMTIGETTYTVNGEEQTMDVAPVIGSGDRTYVPVRFVAEALGYKVTPLYAADGTTASVVFQK